MNIQNYGIILNVENFDACVDFYQRVFHLKEMFSKVDGEFRLSCLEFGNAYLMLETGGIAHSRGKDLGQSPTTLRFNVDNVLEAQHHLSECGIETDIIETDWGTIIRVNDPDGNPISIRDEVGFQRQVGRSQRQRKT